MSRLRLVQYYPFVIQLLLLHLHQVIAPVQAKLYHILQQLSVLLLWAESHIWCQVESFSYVKTKNAGDKQGKKDENLYRQHIGHFLGFVLSKLRFIKIVYSFLFYFSLSL